PVGIRDHRPALTPASSGVTRPAGHTPARHPSPFTAGLLPVPTRRPRLLSVGAGNLPARGQAHLGPHKPERPGSSSRPRYLPWRSSSHPYRARRTCLRTTAITVTAAGGAVLSCAATTTPAPTAGCAGPAHQEAREAS